MAYLLHDKRKNPETGRTETYYRVGWRPNGRGGPQKTEALGFVLSSEARRLLRAKEVELDRAQRAAPLPPPAPASPPSRTVRQLLRDRLLPHLRAREVRPATYTAAEYAVAALEGKLGDLALADLSAASVEGYMNGRRDEGRSAKTIRNEIQVLVQALRLALAEGEITRLPEIRRPKNRRKRPTRFLTPDQTPAVVAAALSAEDALSGLAICLGVELGMRRGEILSRGWEDVKLADGLILVGPKPEVGWEPKGGDPRAVPLSPALVGMLREAWLRAGRPDRGWLFPSPRDPAKPRGNFKRSLATACARAGVDRMSPHALRHTFASRLAGQGVPKVVTAAIGGWSPTSPVLESVYQHAVPAQVRAAVASASVLPSGATQEELPSARPPSTPREHRRRKVAI